MAQKKFTDEQGQELSIEQAFGQIKELLGEMESEDASLEKTFENYEKGMQLLQYCNDRIDKVEKKVQKLNADGSTENFE
jgi:exodeoxyribonuclease VII small subunit